MPAAVEHVDIHASPEVVRGVLTDFARYPEFIPDLRGVTVLAGTSGVGDAWTVEFRVEAVRSVRYTLQLWLDAGGALRWSMVEADVLRANEGAWELEPLAGPNGEAWTRATYRVEIQLAFFVPSPIIAMLTGARLPETLQAFRARAERLAGAS